MSRALQGRLAKLGGPPRDPAGQLTDGQREARIEALAVDLGGFDAVLAGLDDSKPTDRRVRELTQWYLEKGTQARSRSSRAWCARLRGLR
jgi:hypothetical protein